MFDTFNSTVSRAILGTVGTAVCAGLCLLAATAPAAAAEAVRTTTVSYADLNVHTPAGRATLDRRITDAARSVCSSANIGPAARVEEERCVRNAVAAAKPTVG
jgi:UrcA family protein